MMKKLLTLSLCFILVLSFAGCGKKEEDVTEDAAVTDDAGVTVEEEIVKFVNTDLPDISTEKDEAVATFNKYFNGCVDASAWAGELESSALVNFDTFLTNIDALSYTNAEVNNLKDLYRKSVTSERDAVQDVILAINNVDTESLSTASQEIADANTYLTMYQDELISLCDKYNIVTVGEFSEATLTDAAVEDASSGDAE